MSNTYHDDYWTETLDDELIHCWHIDGEEIKIFDRTGTHSPGADDLWFETVDEQRYYVWRINNKLFKYKG